MCMVTATWDNCLWELYVLAFFVLLDVITTKLTIIRALFSRSLGHELRDLINCCNGERT